MHIEEWQTHTVDERAGTEDPLRFHAIVVSTLDTDNLSVFAT